MKKILASILAAFFVVLSPISAYASATTESMMMFSTGIGSDEYLVMPLSFPSTFDYTIYSGVYNRYDESFSFDSATLSNLSNGSFISNIDFFGKHFGFYYKNGDMPVYGFSIGSPSANSNVSIPDGSSLNIFVNDLAFDLRVFGDGITENHYSMSSEYAVPFKVYADMYFTATQQVGTTHSGTYHNQTVEVTNFLRAAQNPPDAYPLSFDIDCTIPIIADQSNINPNIDRLYNINLRYIKVYAVYDLSSFFNLFSNVRLVNQLSFGNYIETTAVYRYFGNDNPLTSFISVNYSDTGGNSDALITNSVQSSISSLGSNITNQVASMKQSLTQSTNTITTRIQTMETNVVSGLSNVVESAKQNTQNIINTVTQKVDQVKETVTEVKDSILDLPNKIQEMLLGLIVPDSDTMADKYSEFSGLLEEKLGVIYQIPMMLFDFFDTIVNAATTPQSTLTLPAFQLPWIDGSQLTIWNSMEYKIIPDGLEVLLDLIRTVTSMTVVVLTFNSVKQAYERFLRS